MTPSRWYCTDDEYLVRQGSGHLPDDARIVTSHSLKPRLNWTYKNIKRTYNLNKKSFKSYID